MQSVMTILGFRQVGDYFQLSYRVPKDLLHCGTSLRCDK